MLEKWGFYASGLGFIGQKTVIENIGMDYDLSKTATKTEICGLVQGYLIKIWSGDSGGARVEGKGEAKGAFAPPPEKKIVPCPRFTKYNGKFIEDIKIERPISWLHNFPLWSVL